MTAAVHRKLAMAIEADYLLASGDGDPARESIIAATRVVLIDPTWGRMATLYGPDDPLVNGQAGQVAYVACPLGGDDEARVIELVEQVKKCRRPTDLTRSA